MVGVEQTEGAENALVLWLGLLNQGSSWGWDGKKGKANENLKLRGSVGALELHPSPSVKVWFSIICIQGNEQRF